MKAIDYLKEQSNNKNVAQTLVDLANALNGKAEYYVTGGLVAFLVSRAKFDRRSSDIDVVILENEVKIEKILKANNFDVWDENMAHRERDDLMGVGGHHNYGTRDLNTGIRIGFFTYKISDKDEIVLELPYGEKNEKGEVVDMLERTIFPKEMRKEDRFWEKPIEFQGVQIYIVSPEQMYLKKVRKSREKDKKDAEKLKPFLDKERLAKLEKLLPKIKIEREKIN